MKSPIDVKSFRKKLKGKSIGKMKSPIHSKLRNPLKR